MVRSLTAKVIGMLFLLFGLLGFIPALTEDGMLLGVFAVNGWHSGLVFLTGLGGIIAGFTKTFSPKTYFQILTFVYGVLAVIGFVLPSPLLGLFVVDRAGTVIHLVTALLSLYLGFFEHEQSDIA